MKLAATMKAGATEPTTPMLSAVVKCRDTNCRVPKAPPPVTANKTIRPGLRLISAQSARRCTSANGSTASATMIQRATARLAGGTCPPAARANTWLPAQDAAASGSRK